MEKIVRLPSGITGLDSCISGGFEENSAILVSGGGGSGKTIFGIQFLLEGIKKNETGVYISFEESKSKFFRHMGSFGWDLEALEKQGNFVFIKYDPKKIVDIVKKGGVEIGNVIKEINAKRIVIDSLSAYSALFVNEADQREMLVALFEMISGWNATCLLIAEEDQYPDKHRSSVMGFMADAIIRLYILMKDNTTMYRAMQISKMRGTHHSMSIFPLTITNHGIVVYPNQEVDL